MLYQNFLNNEQFSAFLAVTEESKSIFLTGEAGSGKSTVIHAIKDWANTNNKRIVLTAPTGIAAQLINGQTLHSFINCYSKDDQVNLVTYSDPEKNNNMDDFISSHEIIVIDEVSMVSRALFQAFYKRIKSSFSRKSKQLPIVVIVGDFYQLAPVCNNFHNEEKFIFKDPLWDEMGFRSNKFFLRTNHRQIGDTRFISLLRNIRSKSLSNDDLLYLNSRLSKNKLLSFHIHICKTNSAVNCINKKFLELAKLNGNAILESYQALFPSDKVTMDEVIRYLKDTAFEFELSLTPGARVMTLINAANYSNGSLGIYRGLKTDDELGDDVLVVEKDNGELIQVSRHLIPFYYYNENGLSEKVFISQFPIRLAYAITIHKSQGQTFDYVRLVLNQPENRKNCNEPWSLTRFNPHGMIYTALSRVRTIDGLTISNSIKSEDFHFDF